MPADGAESVLCARLRQTHGLRQALSSHEAIGSVPLRAKVLGDGPFKRHPIPSTRTKDQ